jgi:hypothetical protein
MGVRHAAAAATEGRGGSDGRGMGGRGRGGGRGLRRCAGRAAGSTAPSRQAAPAAAAAQLRACFDVNGVRSGRPHTLQPPPSPRRAAPLSLRRRTGPRSTGRRCGASRAPAGRPCPCRSRTRASRCPTRGASRPRGRGFRTSFSSTRSWCTSRVRLRPLFSSGFVPALPFPSPSSPAWGLVHARGACLEPRLPSPSPQSPASPARRWARRTRTCRSPCWVISGLTLSPTGCA